MRQVFRIEHVDTKVGPFQTNDEFTQALARVVGSDNELLAPGDDGLMLGLIPFTFVFGCTDIDTLKRWVLYGGSIAENECIIRMLKSKGFRLAESLVEEGDYLLSISGNQVAFDAFGCCSEGLTDYHDLDILMRSSPLVFSVSPHNPNLASLHLLLSRSAEFLTSDAA